MGGIWTMGEMLVEIMRPGADMRHSQTGEYLGPYPSGAPAIFIDTAARLGAEAGIIGGVGKDGFGANLCDRLANDGVDMRYVSESGTGATAVAFVMYKSDGSREFIFHIKGTPATGVVMPAKPVENVSYFHIMGCSLTADPDFAGEIVKTMYQMIENGAKISFDPNIRPELLRGNLNEIVKPVMDNCSVFLPGVDELLKIARDGENEQAETACDDDVGLAVKKLFKNEKLEIIVLKRGAKGCELITREAWDHIPAFPVRQIDPTGSGDCFDAAFLCGLLQGKAPVFAARMAAAAGALNAMAFGPMEGDITMRAIEKMMAGNCQL